MLYLCKKFGPFDTLRVFLKDFCERVDHGTKSTDDKKHEKYLVCSIRLINGTNWSLFV